MKIWPTRHSRGARHSVPKEICFYGLKPVNKSAAGGMHGIFIPFPGQRIDCRYWSEAKLWKYFEKRHPDARDSLIRNKNYTEIAFILDRSGSMDSCQDAAIEGFNRFLRDQQQAEGLAKLTLVLFDDEYLVAAQSLPVQELVALTRETYVPRNTTALLDAIGQTIDDLGKRLAQIPEEDRPGQVIVTILTDGLENASHRFTWRDISAKIKHQTESYKWTFLFLGANQDAIATAAQMNIAAANSATYAADEVGARSSMGAASKKVRAMRHRAMECASEEDIESANAPMSEIVQEEDRKERGA